MSIIVLFTQSSHSVHNSSREVLQQFQATLTLTITTYNILPLSICSQLFTRLETSLSQFTVREHLYL